MVGSGGGGRQEEDGEVYGAIHADGSEVFEDDRGEKGHFISLSLEKAK